MSGDSDIGARSDTAGVCGERCPSSSISLADEIWVYFDAAPRLLEEERRYFTLRGIAPDALDLADGLRAAEVIEFGRRFVLLKEVRSAEPRRRVVLMLAREPDGTPTDLVCWCPDTGWLAPWLGRVGLLGDAWGSRLGAGGALPIWRDPWMWIAARQEGVVVVDEVVAALELRDAGRLQAENEEHGFELKKLLEASLPAVTWPNKVKEAA